MQMKATGTIDSPIGAEITVEGRRYINFGGSSYLGLSSKPEIVEAGLGPLRANGAGYQFGREFRLATRAHLEVEAEAAAFFGTESALHMAAGYYFGFMALAAMRKDFTTIFIDEWAHHSLREAAVVSGLVIHAFKHLDAADLEDKLRRHLPSGGRPLVLTDGMYSTFGEIAPLDQLVRLAASYGGKVLVDESHSFGVLGEHGLGVCEQWQVPADSILRGGSTCKALGVVGGIVPASDAEIAALRTTPIARGASAGLAAAAAMCAASFRYIRRHPELLIRLRANIAYMKGGLKRIGFDAGDNIAPVAAFDTGARISPEELQKQLMVRGIHVFHSTYIGAGSRGVIRCGIFADHTQEHIDQLLDALQRFS